MAIDSILEISGSGLDLNRLQLKAIASNIANANTVVSAGGAAYQPVEVVGYSYGYGSFNTADDLNGIDAIDFVPRDTETRKVFDPGHPEADPAGYVEYPNINPIEEMTTLMTVVRSYEANIKSIAAAKAMALKALEIGK